MAKHKILKSIAHNHSHSFVSFNNYVDDGFVIDDLRHTIRDLGENTLSIYWIPDQEQSKLLTPRILKSISFWKSSLAELIANSGGSIEHIKEYRTDFYLKPNRQIAVEGRIVDDRGRVYVSPIYEF